MAALEKLQEEYEKNLKEFNAEQQRFKEQYPEKVKEEQASPEDLVRYKIFSELGVLKQKTKCHKPAALLFGCPKKATDGIRTHARNNQRHLACLHVRFRKWFLVPKCSSFVGIFSLKFTYIFQELGHVSTHRQ